MSIVARARSSVASLVHGAPHSSTTGTRCGGLTGCATRQRARPGKIGGEVRRDDRRRAAREYRVGRREPVEFGESGSLDRDFLRQVFLHPRGIGQCIAQPDARRDTRRVPRARPRPVPLVPARQALARSAAAPQQAAPARASNSRTVPAGAREHHRPRAADQSGADDRCNSFHAFTSRARAGAVARSSRSAAAGP